MLTISGLIITRSVKPNNHMKLETHNTNSMIDRFLKSKKFGKYSAKRVISHFQITIHDNTPPEIPELSCHKLSLCCPCSLQLAGVASIRGPM